MHRTSPIVAPSSPPPRVASLFRRENVQTPARGGFATATTTSAAPTAAASSAKAASRRKAYGARTIAPSTAGEPAALKLAQICEINTNELHRRPILTIDGHICRNECREIITGLEGKRYPASPGIVVAKICVIGPINIPILCHGRHGGANGQRVADWRMHGAAQVHEAIGACGYGYVAFEIAARLWFARGNRYGATDGVAAEQRALRSAQYFQSLNIDDIQNGTD